MCTAKKNAVCLGDKVRKENIQEASLLFNNKLWSPSLDGAGLGSMLNNCKDIISCFMSLKWAANGKLLSSQ